MQNAFKFYLILYFVLTHEAFTKSLTKQNSKDRDNVEDDKEEESGQTDQDEGITCEHSSNSRAEGHKSRAHHSQKEMSKRHSRGDTAGEEEEDSMAQCAVMYKNNHPVGILQPFEDSYKFLPISGESTIVDINPLPAKRKSMMDVLYPSITDEDYVEKDADDRAAFSEEGVDNTNQKVGYYDEKFPYLLAKFKIHSKLDTMRNNVLNPSKKDDAIALDDKQVGSLKSTLTKMKSDDSVAVEEELRDILDQMGLIDEEPGKETQVKREVEDENLEIGTNNINLVKDEHSQTRSKRENTQANTATSPKVSEMQANYVANSDENPTNTLLKKREDITPVASSTATSRTEEKREILMETLPSSNLDSTPDLLEDQVLDTYEKRVEREIRDKIQKLKEEVKKEIDALKSNKDKKAASDDSRRKKRQVINTLIDEETQDIDPNFNSDIKQKAHIRRKRSIIDDEVIPFNEGDNNTDIFKSRQLKGFGEIRDGGVQNDEGDEAYFEDYDENTRQKRDEENDKEDSYYNDEAEFADNKENDAKGKSVERAKKEVASYEANKKCKCEKNGNCKCGIIDESPNSKVIHDYTNFMVDPEIVKRDVMMVDNDNSGRHQNCEGTNCNNNCHASAKVAEEDYLDFGESSAGIVEKKRSIDAEDDSFGSKLKLKTHRMDTIEANNENDVDENDYADYESETNNKLSKREIKTKRLTPFENGEYFVDLHPNMYRLSPIEGVNADEMEPFHAVPRTRSSPPKRRRAADQNRRHQHHHRIRRTAQNEDDTKEPRHLIDMSDEDLFGALPQSYEGELARYKRVKRSET